MTLKTIFTVCGISLLASATCALADGKAAFMESNCAQCHSVSSEGITATMMGLELDGIGAKRDATSISEYLRAGAPHPLPWSGSDEDLAAIAEWLASNS